MLDVQELYKLVTMKEYGLEHINPELFKLAGGQEEVRLNKTYKTTAIKWPRNNDIQAFRKCQKSVLLFLANHLKSFQILQHCFLFLHTSD